MTDYEGSGTMAEADHSPAYQDEYRRLWHRDAERARQAEEACDRLMVKLAQMIDERAALAEALREIAEAGHADWVCMRIARRALDKLGEKDG